jgi:hypothetical protein
VKNEGLVEPEAVALLKNQLDLEELTDQTYAFETLKALIRPKIKFLLDNNMEGLLNICYRIDVEEKGLKSAINDPDPQAVDLRITELILERFIEKAKWRKKYST